MPHPLRITLALAAATLAASAAARAQIPDTTTLEEVSLSGPRIGFTYVTGPAARARLAEYELDPFMSQFGWHFEQIVLPRRGGPAFVIQEVLLVGAVDQGRAVPSATMLLGIRMPGGFEFGMGPNLSPTGAALAIGVGKSINYGGVAIPLNLAIVRSPGALRTSFLFGYALRRRPH